MLKQMVRGIGGPRNPAQSRTNPPPPRPFLPPSHYARAAGIGIHSVPQELHGTRVSDDTYENGFLPISYPNGAQTSDSSTDTSENRFTVLCKKKSCSVFRSNSNSSRNGRITGLPQLEREILPSLKDTVDRMTRPPSVAVPMSPQSTSEHEHRTLGGSMRSNRFSGLPVEVTSPKAPPKSALRTPTPRLAFKNDPISISSSIPGPSKLQKVSPLKKHGNPPAASVLKTGTRQRSTTDPGVGPLQRQNDKDFSTPQAKSSKQPLVSQIPRINGKSFFSRRTPLRGIDQSYYRFSQDIVDETSLPGIDDALLASWDAATPMPKYTKAEVGLGLGIDSERTYNGLSAAGRPWASLRKASSRIRYNHPSPSAGTHVRQPYSPEKWSPASPSPTSEETDSGHSRRRRHADLLGVVSNIVARPCSPHVLQSSESDYYGEDGVAISAPRTDWVPDGQLGQSCGYSINKDEVPNPSSPPHRPSPLLAKYGQPFTSPPSPIERDLGRIPTHRNRSSTRSPIVHQESAHVALSASKRHSVYRPVSLNRTDESRIGSKYTANVDLTRMSNALEIASMASAIADRERASLGLPSSVSDYRGSQPISYAESHLSTLEHSNWQESTQELSSGAELLFKSLGNQLVLPSSRTGQRPERDPRTPPRLDSKELPYNTGSVTPRCLVIQEVIQTEESYNELLRLFVSLYILPLRVQDSRTWISGVPTEVSSLFDWYEDITNMHHQFLGCMWEFQGAYPEDRFAERIRPVISSFEVYQPYLVRLANVLHNLNKRLRDSMDDFGEFIRIQESSTKRSNQRIEPLLREPLNRLERYPELFKRLLNATPKSHPDYLSTFSLFHSTDLAIRVLTEVKNREEEYHLIKQLSTRIWKLPRSAQLPQRERRLLLQGLLRLQPSNWKASDISDQRRSPDEPSRPSNRSSRLVDAVNEWSSRRERSDSVTSTSTGTSYSSYSSSSSSSSSAYYAVRTPTTSQFLSSSFPVFHPPRQLASPIAGNTVDAPSVQVFVFTDLIILADPVPNNPRDEWTLHEQPGLARILGVTENPNDLDVLTLDILLLKPEDLNDTLSFDDTVVQRIHLKLPGRDQVTNGTRQSWLTAFQSCLRSTLQLAALPGYREAHIGEVSTEMKGTVLSLLASGLPLPKSPSMQQSEYHSGEPQDNARQEREQRGWWALRFHQVLQEFLHRGDDFAP